MIVFEFDEKKSRSNLEKHGIDFHVAQELWKDPGFIEMKVKFTDEPRLVVIGRILSKYWSSVVTYRNKRIRLFSQALSQERGRTV